MNNGFFKQSQIQSKKINQRVPSTAQCGKCKLYQTCKNPKMPATGRGKIKLLSLAEAPGAEEDKKNEQLIGKVGQYYRRIMRSFEIDIDDGMKTNANICRPPKNKTPTLGQIKACRPNLVKTLNEFQPHVIIALGEVAVQSLIDHKFSKKVEGMQKWAGHIIPDREYNAWICPTFHPSYVQRETTPEIVEKYFKDHLRHAVKMLDVPLPEYSKDETQHVEILKHEKETVSWLMDLMKKESVLTAFDYETTGLKPQKKEQAIRTCSISLGPYHAVAFPIFDSDRFLSVFRSYLSSPKMKKIAANMK